MPPMVKARRPIKSESKRPNDSTFNAASAVRSVQNTKCAVGRDRSRQNPVIWSQCLSKKWSRFKLVSPYKSRKSLFTLKSWRKGSNFSFDFWEEQREKRDDEIFTPTKVDQKS